MRRCGLKWPADEVVGPGLEDPRDLLVAFERREHDDGQIARLRARLRKMRRIWVVAVRARHHEIEQHDRRLNSSICSSASAPEPTATCGRSICEGLDQYMSTNGVVVDDEDGATRHHARLAAFNQPTDRSRFCLQTALHRSGRVSPATARNLFVSLEEALLSGRPPAADGRRSAKGLVRFAVRDAPARGSPEVPLLDQERLDHVLEGVAWLGQRGRPARRRLQDRRRSGR